MKKIGKGFKWAKHEHNWENRTTLLMILSLMVICLSYHYNVYPAEIGLASIVLITVVHSIARLCHRMEQHYFKEMRHPKH